MTTYLAITNDGRTKHITAFTYADAFQQAAEFAGDFGLRSFNEI